MYDFVIIGSGLGGLQCAYILADHGYRVCVLEKNHQIGGSLQVFSRQKTVFDTGVHYLPALDKGQPLHTCFQYFGLTDKVKWKKMDECFDEISFNDGSHFHLSSSWEKFRENLLCDFPAEEKAIDTYINTVNQVVSTFPLDRLQFSERGYTDENILTISAKLFIDSLTKDRKLRAVLAGNNLLYAGSADKCPLYVHALVTHGYVLSAYRCVDGGSQLARELAKNIRDAGGQVLRRKKVVGFEVHNGALIAALTEDGNIYRAKNFISDIQPKVLLQLIGKQYFRPSFFNRIMRSKNTLSCFAVHIVCKPRSFPYLNYNIYHHTTDDVWAEPEYTEQDWPRQYMLCTPATSRSDEYAQGISIMTYMRFDEVERWKDSCSTVADPNIRPQEYVQWKIEKTEKLLDLVEKRFPNIRQCIEHVDASTPLTFRDYIGTDDGNMYGTEKDYRRPLINFISPNTKIPNLWLTGQNLNLHGIFGVTISSIITCSQFIDKKELLERIKSASCTK